MAFNVLVVDDSGVMRAMIIKTMKMSGIELGEVHQAANGAEGLDALKDNWIDFVVVDINMPVMNGEEMIDRMLADPDIKSTPKIVISTEGSEERIERLRKKGAEFIHKPFSPETIRDIILAITGTGAENEQGI
ncbi:two-component system, chemotaxis family, chemotaxis protein CheY [Desulfosarcina sp. BuS5]|uniref:response regulator n=1 Tax=Desulfosarcina sp. BuS5 TaxID=933262 RepID=UPI0004820609|nr:response regulator [Desulfosarcina sp. BuS5]WDN90009.1 two-component system, chemotaxis family, chemotaxis protein CheY [Desulfosarcina sp. BuS5]